MTPEEAKLKYEAEWPALNAIKEDAMAQGDAKAAKKARQQLSHLSDMCSARFELNKVPEPDIKRLCALENDNGNVVWAIGGSSEYYKLPATGWLEIHSQPVLD